MGFRPKGSMMKNTVKSAFALLMALTLVCSLCAGAGCATTHKQKDTEQKTMYDFIGGGKPEFDGNKY